ncbi:hypothetical protein Pmani_039499, partial [Petrolisthes manimaculis]
MDQIWDDVWTPGGRRHRTGAQRQAGVQPAPPQHKLAGHHCIWCHRHVPRHHDTPGVTMG